MVLYRAKESCVAHPLTLLSGVTEAGREDRCDPVASLLQRSTAEGLCLSFVVMTTIPPDAIHMTAGCGKLSL
jgi:hypothetical protein